MKSDEKRTTIIAIVLVIAAVAAVAGAIYLSNRPQASDSQNATDTEHMMEGDNKLATLQGDAFDEAYIADMLAHHEGAVNMAEQAQAMTERDEIRQLASDIMVTQSEEMMQMREWQKEWGYEATNTGGHMSHGGDGMDMAGDMVEMQNALEGLEGAAYDKEFLKQMILHHEQAVEMSRPAAENAKHQEIRDLANAVITAQQKEIDAMKQWQVEWGY